MIEPNCRDCAQLDGREPCKRHRQPPAETPAPVSESDVTTIPLNRDTECAKCHQRLGFGDGVTTTHCTDDGRHEWQSNEKTVIDLRARLAASDLRIKELEQQLKACKCS